jgi:acetylxylan esterase
MISSVSSWCFLAISTFFTATNGGLIASNALVPVTNFGANPTSLQMSIYVPTKLATDPAIILAASKKV